MKKITDKVFGVKPSELEDNGEDTEDLATTVKELKKQVLETETKTTTGSEPPSTLLQRVKDLEEKTENLATQNVVSSTQGTTNTDAIKYNATYISECGFLNQYYNSTTNEYYLRCRLKYTQAVGESVSIMSNLAKTPNDIKGACFSITDTLDRAVHAIFDITKKADGTLSFDKSFSYSSTYPNLLVDIHSYG